MRALVFSDLHFDYSEGATLTLKKEFFIRKIDGPFDCVLLCGDAAEYSRGLYNHEKLLDFFKETFDAQIGFIAGNHDLWGGRKDGSSRILHELLPKIAEASGATYLEDCNLQAGGFTIAGTYCHYDYTLGKIGGLIRLDNILSGRLDTYSGSIFWNDKKFMDWGRLTDKEVCLGLLVKFEERIAGIENLVTLSHHLPDVRLSGHTPGVRQDFLGAYSGSTRLGEILAKSNSRYHFCGHTHAAAELLIGKTRAFNLGTDYTFVRYLTLDTDSESVEAHTFRVQAQELKTKRKS